MAVPGVIPVAIFLENGHDDILMSWVYKPILPGLMSFSPIVIGLLSGGGDSPSLP